MDNTSWFELKNGGFIGINNTGILYGKRSSAFDMPSYSQVVPVGEEVVISTKAPVDLIINRRQASVNINSSVHYFRSTYQAKLFSQTIFKLFPKSRTRIPSVSEFRKPPVGTLIILTVLLIIGLISEPEDVVYSGKGRINELMSMLITIPKEYLLMGYLLLCALAVWKLSPVAKTRSHSIIIRILA